MHVNEISREKELNAVFSNALLPFFEFGSQFGAVKAAKKYVKAMIKNIGLNLGFEIRRITPDPHGKEPVVLKAHDHSRGSVLLS